MMQMRSRTVATQLGRGNLPLNCLRYERTLLLIDGILMLQIYQKLTQRNFSVHIMLRSNQKIKRYVIFIAEVELKMTH